MAGKILVKFHRENVVAICDADLIGKKIDNGEVCIQISERFYSGREMDKESIVSLMKDSINLNIVGENSVNLAIKAGLIGKSSVKNIKGVPFAQIYAV